MCIRDSSGRQLQDALRQIAASRRSALTRFDAGLRPELMRLRISRSRERLAATTARLGRSVAERTRRHRAALDTQAKLLATLGYQSVLQRGYALVRTADGRMLRAAANVEAGAAVTLEFHDGARTARIDGASANPATPPANDTATTGSSSGATGQPARAHPEPGQTRTKRKIKPSERDKQGSLF